MYNMSRVTTHTLSRLSPLNPATRPTEGHWTEDAGSNFGEALRAFGERDEVKEAGGTLAVATVAATVAEPISAATSWACGKCTSVNEASATACNLCSSPHASAPPPTCTDCEDGPSTHHCAECVMDFCSRCLVVHATKKRTKDHSVVPVLCGEANKSTPKSQGEAHEQEVEEKKAEADLQPGELP